MLIFLPCGNSSIREMKLRFQLSAVISNLVLLLAASIDAMSSNDLISDSNALLNFSYSVPHARKLNWNQSTSLCTSWVGIICSQDRTQVHEIHLPAFGLYGRIPQQTLGRLKSLRVLSLRSNYLNGTLPPDLLSIPSLQFVFLQNNNLSGGLPIYLSSKLTVLDLSFNSLSGEIPSTVGNLTTLSVLNLQSNSFSGNIPSLDLPALQVLNLSHNSLSGPIPDSLRNLPVSSFVGNSLLCGPPLNSCLLVSPSPSASPSAAAGGKRLYGQRKLGATIATGVAGACLVFITFSAVVFFCLKRKNKGRSRTNRIIAKAANVGQTENLKSDDFGSGVQGAEKNKLVFLDGCSFVFDLEDLLRASAEVLGKGSYGTVYRAILDESNSVVVKRLKDVGGIGKKEFEQQIEIIGGAAAAAAARHPNVAPLLAYYFSQDEKLLVYRYMPGGSLSSALHGNREMERRPLDWESRLNIALNAARGLAHIHSICGALNIHGNIKSSNVLLAADLTACISDFGLSPMMSFIPVNSRVPGYRAPEVIETRKVNQKSDVYGFGVVLLEMLTGKSPVQSSGREEVVDLPRWVRSVVREEWTAEVFDVQLTKGKYVEEEMVQMLQIGLSCVAKAADMRPAMDDVVRMIEDVRASSVDNQSKGSNADTPP